MNWLVTSSNIDEIKSPNGEIICKYGATDVVKQWQVINEMWLNWLRFI